MGLREEQEQKKQISFINRRIQWNTNRKINYR